MITNPAALARASECLRLTPSVYREPIGLTPLPLNSVRVEFAEGEPIIIYGLFAAKIRQALDNQDEWESYLINK
jgi:hypothetical protein